MVLIAHLWPLSQKHLHFNRKQAEDFATYLRTECCQELLRQQAGGSAEEKLQITPLGRKSVCCSDSKTGVCLLVALQKHKTESR